MLRSALAEEINRRLLLLVGTVGLMGTVLTAAASGSLAVLQANRDVATQADQISQAVSTILQLEATLPEKQAALQLYRNQPFFRESDVLNAVLVLDASGRTILSSRQALINRSVQDLRSTPLLRDGDTQRRIDCFLAQPAPAAAAPAKSCELEGHRFHWPWSTTQIALREVQLFQFGVDPKRSRYLILISLGTQSTNSGVLQLVVLMVLSSALILGLMLWSLTWALRRQLLPGLQQLAETDGLTTLANRRNFMDLSQQALHQAETSQTSHVLAILDIDHFKRINDQHGHLAGDAVLRQLADTLRDGLRDSDLVARLGGEEFALLLRCDAVMADEVLERLRSSVEFSECVWDDAVIPVTISLGAAATEHLGFDLDYLYAAADASLYRAKTEGRNCIRWATARKSDPERESWTSRLFIQA